MKSLKLIGLAWARVRAVVSGAGPGHHHRRGGPMTGGESAFGRQMKTAPTKRFADLNAAGGCSQEAGAVCWRRCLRSQAGTLGGGKNRQCQIRVAAILFVVVRSGRRLCDGNVLQITPARPIRCSPSASSGTWRASAVATISRGLVAAEYIAKFYKARMSPSQRQDTYGKGLADETKKALNKAGFTEKMFESYNKGDKDFNSIVSRLKRDNIDLCLSEAIIRSRLICARCAIRGCRPC